jgi:hypothetical protein
MLTVCMSTGMEAAALGTPVAVFLMTICSTYTGMEVAAVRAIAATAANRAAKVAARLQQELDAARAKAKKKGSG